MHTLNRSFFRIFFCLFLLVLANELHAQNSEVPTAVITGETFYSDTDGQPGEIVTFSGAESLPALTEAELTSFIWTLNGQELPLSPSPELTTFAPDGESTLSLVVIDADGMMSEPTEITFFVNSPVRAVIDGGDRVVPDTDGVPGENVTLSAAGSTVPITCECTPVYQWTVNGELSSDTSENPTFRLPDGTNTVSLVVLAGDVASQPQTVTILVAGVMTITIDGGSRAIPDTDGQPGEIVTLNASAFSGDRELPPSAFSWVVELTVDGQTTVVAQAEGTNTPTFSLPDGSNRVTLTVVDAQTDIIQSTSVVLTVGDDGSTGTSDPISSQTGLTDNQRAAASELERLCFALQDQLNLGTELTPEQSDFLARCQALIQDFGQGGNPAVVGNVLNELSGQRVTAMQHAGMTFSSGQFQNVSARLTQLRQGIRGVSFSGLQLVSPEHARAVAAFKQFVSTLLADEDDDRGGGTLNDLLGDRFGIFVNGQLRSGSHNATANEGGFDARDRGLTAGLDYRYSDSLVVGFAGGYGRGKTEFDGSLSRLDTKTLSGSVYGAWYSDRLHLDWIATFGELDYESRRAIVLNTGLGTINRMALGVTEGRQKSFGITAGYDFRRGGLLFGPELSVNLMRLKVDAFEETGADGLNLIIGEQKGRSVSIRAGGFLNYAWSTRVGVISPHARAAYVRETAGTTDTVYARFAIADDNGPGFELTTDSPDRGYFSWSAGVSAQFAHGIAAFVDYQSFANLDNMSSSELTLGMRIQTRF